MGGLRVGTLPAINQPTPGGVGWFELRLSFEQSNDFILRYYRLIIFESQSASSSYRNNCQGNCQTYKVFSASFWVWFWCLV